VQIKLKYFLTFRSIMYIMTFQIEGLNKMTYFDYEYCYILGAGMPKKILRAFELTKNRRGNDFLINEEGLLKSKASALHKAQYLGLAALRNYDDYAESQRKTLSRGLIPNWIKLGELETNPLITITETEIILNKE